MEVDHYFETVGIMADRSRLLNIAPHELVEKPGDHTSIVQALVSFRESMLTSEDEDWLTGYLSIGLFSDRGYRERLASFALAFEIDRELKRREIRRLCRPYTKDQRLFDRVPPLFDSIRERASGQSDRELIDLEAVVSVGGSEVYRAGSGFTTLCPYLSPKIVNWVIREWPGASTFIRLDADQYFEERPPQALMESAIVPASPRWLKDFSLRKGMKDFGSYQLLGRPLSDGHAEFWDYHVKMVRRLEVHVERRKDDYLSVMIEELPRPDDPDGLMIGRCIHLDTRDPAGTSIGDVKMQHLDLAINVYEGDDRRKRYDESLQQGKVIDATFRTHLLRIEDVPFTSLFTFAGTFLQSKVLLSEWVSDLIA
ncbi:hypothetical protein [Rhizobium sp. BK060]|uniref:hypothetical protein n=1 Tax=Rhizobium sp. BK060 TaxID=2587096 RepID=UPI00160C31A6|nr:hypothetical protein [Rhizobium sp. BK060]MBB3394249.1 hypothetical protein [Rhizobium sp. BK060]